VLRSRFFSAEQVEALVVDYRTAGLDPTEEAIAAFAEKVVLRAEQVTQVDIDALRAHGLDDAEIVDIALVAAARLFWSRANDAIGYEPSQSLLERAQSLFGERTLALMVGRRFVQPGAASNA
jgi:hypothetical protein